MRNSPPPTHTHTPNKLKTILLGNNQFSYTSPQYIKYIKISRITNMCFDSELTNEEKKNQKLLEGNSNNIKFVWCAMLYLSLAIGNVNCNGDIYRHTWLDYEIWSMMTSSNGSIFRVTGPLCGEFTAHRWIPLTKASGTEIWCFLWSAPE